MFTLILTVVNTYYDPYKDCSYRGEHPKPPTLETLDAFHPDLGGRFACFATNEITSLEAWSLSSSVMVYFENRPKP